MPISINITGASTHATATSLQTFMLNVDASGTDRCLFVHVGGIDVIASTSGVSAITYGSQSMTLAAKTINLGTGDDVASEIWYLVNPSGGDNTCRVALAAAFNAVKSYGICLNGVNQTQPIDNTGGTITGSAVTVTGIVTTRTENAWILNALAYNGNHGSGTAGVLIDTGTVSGHATWVEEVDVALNGTSGGVAFARQGPIVNPQVITGTWTGLPGGIHNALNIISVRPSIYPVGGSRRFNGSTDSINAGLLDDVLQDNQPLTIGVWIKPYSVGELADGRIVSRINSPTFSAGPIFGTTNATFNSLIFANGGATTLIHQSDNPVTLGVWQYVSVTWDGSTTAANARLYINLIECTYFAGTNGVTPGDNVAQPLFIGNENGGTRSFDGCIAHLQIFDRIISLSEMKATMYAPGSVRNGLRRYYPLRGAASPEPDTAGIAGILSQGVLSGTTPASGPQIGRSLFLNRRLSGNYKFPSTAGGAAFTTNLTLSIAVTESHSKDYLKVLLQSLLLTEARSFDLQKPFADTLNLSESSLYTIQKHVSDILSITLTETQYKDYLKVLTQPINVTEASLYTLGKLIALSDTIGLTETQQKDVLKAISDSLTMTENQAKNYLKVLVENLTLSESSLQGFYKNIDLLLSIVMSDALSKDILRQTIQTITLSESRTIDTLKALSESMTLTNTMAKDFLKVISQAMTLSESRSFDFLKSLNQAVSVSESPSKDILRALRDNLLVTESQAKNFLKVITQAITITESPNLSLVVIVSSLLTFLCRGNIDTHDKIAMTHDLAMTGSLKADNDWSENLVVATAVLKLDDDQMTKDSDQVSWDWDNGQ